ncbi:MAG: sigma-70 family RNA polymerase sigma factor [Bacteroidales bacterium]|nr:sigma-70 family RNA polymerase sigma factor [Bacteroidales bacterium]
MHLISRETQRNEPQAVEQKYGQNLINACRKGDRSSQKRLYDSLAPKMFALCLRYMGRRDEAEDVLQDGFVTLFSKLDSFSGEGSFEGWARKIFVNTALMSLRKRDALKMSDDLDTARSLSTPSPSQLQNIGYKELLGLVADLPAGYRTVFNMFVVEGYTHKEIAQHLGISEATSRSQLQRARMLLQEKIGRL